MPVFPDFTIPIIDVYVPSIASDLNIGILFRAWNDGSGLYGPLLAGMAPIKQVGIIVVLGLQFQFLSYE